MNLSILTTAALYECDNLLRVPCSHKNVVLFRSCQRSIRTMFAIVR